jgi:hypothetical protein
MRKIKTNYILIKLIIFVIILTIGCSEKTMSPAKLTLKFTPEEVETYKVMTETRRRVDWESAKVNQPDSFAGGQTGNKMEMTFSQQIQNIDEQGNTIAKITITGLKYSLEEKNKIILDFDNSREQDQKNPLSTLIGKSYTIEITPTGECSRIVNINDTLADVSKSSQNDQTTLRLLSIDAIKKRHTIPALPAVEENEFQAGQTWSKVENFSFGMMGAQSYEKTYTLEKIEEAGNHRIAIARMNAIPSVEQAKELYQEQGTSIFSGISDNKETYTGQLKLDLTTGKIVECNENLTAEWIIVDPNPKNPGQPDALKMTAIQSYSIEKID